MTSSGGASEPAPGTIDPREAAHFAAQASDWWDPDGKSAMLHKLQPARLAFIRRAIDRHWAIDATALRPLAGKRALDVGCGGGLVTEALARMGAQATGLDAAQETVAVARAHAAAMGLAIEYRAGAIEMLDAPPFDLVTALEVIEHVADPALFVSHLARLLAPGGLMILSTPNRTLLSRLVVVTLAEASGAVPRGTHEWTRFITPAELTDLLAPYGLVPIETRGLMADPRTGFVLSDRLGLDYIMAVSRAGAAA